MNKRVLLFFVVMMSFFSTTKSIHVDKKAHIISGTVQEYRDYFTPETWHSDIEWVFSLADEHGKIYIVVLYDKWTLVLNVLVRDFFYEGPYHTIFEKVYE